MKPFDVKKILIPVDFSETSLLAIKHAAFMAKLFKADITLLHVVEKNWESFSIVAPEIVVENKAVITQKIDQKLKELANSIHKEYSVVVSHFFSNGNIYEEIQSVCKEKNIDLVVMGTHGASGFEEFFIGSNTYKVVTQSDCPVLSVQTIANKIGFHNILLPVDNTMHSLQKVNVALKLAERYAAKIHICGLLEDVADATDVKKIELKIEHVKKFIENHKISHTTTVLKGKNYAKTTLEYAQKNTDLIVIMTDQEDDITGLFLGPYAQQIVNHSKIPVLSIQPETGNLEFPDLSGGYHA